MVPTQDEARAERTRISIEDGPFDSDQAEVRVAFDRHAVARDGNLDEVLLRFAQRVAAAEELARQHGEDLINAQHGHEVTKRSLSRRLDEARDMAREVDRLRAELAKHASDGVTIERLTKERDEAQRIWAPAYLAALRAAERERDEAQTERDELIVSRDAMEARLLRGHVCTSACRENAHVAFEGRHLVRDLERQIAEAQAERDAMRTQLSQEVERADANKAWAERAEQRLADCAVQLSGEIAARTFYQGALETIRKAVFTEPVTESMISAQSVTEGSALYRLGQVMLSIREVLLKAEGGPPAQG